MPNESAKIILAVTHAKLSKVRDALAVEGTINALQVGFQFRTPDWDNTTKTVVFVRGRATPSTTNADTTYRMLDENNECDVPSEMLAQNGMFSVGIFGVRDNYRIVSNWMCYRITDGCYADGSTPIDPSSTIYEQIISMINNKSSIGHNHDERYYTKDESNDKFLTEEDVPKQVQSDWEQNDNTSVDYIKNRPFYEDVSVDITWDGNTTGKTEVDLTSALGFNVYLVSDATPSAEDLNGYTLTVYNGSSSTEQSMTLPAQALSENVIIVGEGNAFVVLADNSEIEGITFPSKGTYLASADGNYVSRITKKVVNKIDKKFIPNGIDTLKITVTYNSSGDTYSKADKSSDDIETCLNNGGIPYIALYGRTSDYSDYIILTYVGYGGSPKRHVFANEGEGIALYIRGFSVRSGLSSQSLKGRINYLEDNTVKTVSQVLTDEQKAQARMNIGAGTQYTLPEASSSEFGGIKADDVTETDTQAVRKGADGKLYTAAAVPQVQSDYTQNDNTQTDYIKNRPFYEDASINIEWDGDTTGKTSVSDVFYLVSSDTPSVEDLIGCTVTVHTDSGEEHSEVITETMISQPADNVIDLADTLFVALEDGAGDDISTFPTKGTYFLKHGNLYIVSLFKGTLKKLDPKFIDMDSLPKEVLKITVTYDSSTDTYSADKTSDDIKTCLDNGGIPYVYFTLGYNEYTLTGYSADLRCYRFSNIHSTMREIDIHDSGDVTVVADSKFFNNLEHIDNKVTAIDNTATNYQYPSALAVKTELDNTVKTTEQTLTDEQKAQARTNIGAVPSPDTADVGQLLVVKTVDDEGKVTETEGLDEITLLINADLLPSVYNTDGKILTDNSGRIILRY